MLGTGSAEDTRLSYHYGGNTSILFNTSIVSQSYLAVGPFLLYALWRTVPRRTLGRVGVYAFAVVLLFLVANSLERTTPAILAVWFLLAAKAAGRKTPRGIVVGGPLAFLLVTITLHGSTLSGLPRVFQLQVLRRVFVVNSMVNYFALERFGERLPLRYGGTYVEYMQGIAAGGGGFARELMTIIYPDRVIGTAPVGLIAEGWVNFGFGVLLLGLPVGFLVRWLDSGLVRLNTDVLGSVLFGGIATLVGTMSYSAPLATLFSGGLLFMVVAYVLCRPQSLLTALREPVRVDVRSG